jgi:hypothetical protein
MQNDFAMDARNRGMLDAKVIVRMSADTIGAQFEVNQLGIQSFRFNRQSRHKFRYSFKAYINGLIDAAALYRNSTPLSRGFGPRQMERTHLDTPQSTPGVFGTQWRSPLLSTW